MRGVRYALQAMRLGQKRQKANRPPTLDEDKLRRAILEAINGLDQTGQEITEEFLDIASLVQQGQEGGGGDPLALRQRLVALTAEQAELMEQALALPENMENKELNARLREIAEELIKN